MNLVTYSITLLEPLLVPSIEGDPNSAVSYPYIPGSSLLGALVAAYKREKKRQAFDIEAEEVRRLFFDGHTRYLNAYPLIHDDNSDDDKRMLPTPLSWHVEKGEKQPIFDFAIEANRDDEEPVQYKPKRSKDENLFCWLDDNEVKLYAPSRQVNVHTSRNRRKGRALKRDVDSAVFQYDALAPGERFGGVILAEQKDDAELLKKLLSSGLFSIGGSQSAGYGRVRVDLVEVMSEAWREVPEPIEDIEPDDPFVVTLLSNTLIRDRSSGQYTTDIRSALERFLKVSLELIPPPEEADESEQRSVFRTEEVGGFNRKWGLPLPQAQAIRAGSVFVFTASQPISADTLHRLEWQGIGERRAEGFGRLVFNWQREEELKVVCDKQEETAQELPTLSGLSQELGQKMAERLLRRDLDQNLRKRINALEIVSPPSNAQLSRMRVIARDALPTGDVQRLLKLLKSIRERKASNDQFEQARIKDGSGLNKRLVRWLKEHLEKPEEIWSELSARNLKRQLALNVISTTENNEALAREYTIRLIDGVLAKATQERRSKEGN
ncbi:MAG: type III-D CRISPR-associated RAMP protein Csx10 [Ardenticatenaceae bacterium]